MKPLPLPALAALAHGMSSRPWLEGFDPQGRLFASALTGAFVAALPSDGASVALSAASASASAELPLAPGGAREIWTKAALVLALRDALREADLSSDRAVLEALARVAFETATAVDAAAPCPAAAPTGGLDALLDPVREALASARDGAVGDPSSAPFVTTFFNHMRRSLSLLAMPGARVEPLLRAAVTRADAAARQYGEAGWLATPFWSRAALARRCLAELAGALAEPAPRTLVTGAGRASAPVEASCLLAARLACQSLSLLRHAETWLAGDDPGADSPSPSQPTHIDLISPVSHTPSLPPETTMNPSDTTPKAKHPLLQTLQNDATDAAWRTAGSQFVKLTREPLVAVLTRHLGPDDPALRGKIAAFLETEIGTSMLTSILSLGLSAMPGAAGEVPQKLARELRVRAMADMGDLVAEVLTGPLRQVMAFYLQDVQNALPPAPPAELSGHAGGKAGNVTDLGSARSQVG